MKTRWKFNKHLAIKVVLFKRKIAKKVFCKNTEKSQIIINTKNRDKLSVLYSIFAQLHLPSDNPNRVKNRTKLLQETKTDGYDLTDGLKGDNSEKFEELNIKTKNVFELNEVETLTTPSVVKNWNHDTNN